MTDEDITILALKYRCTMSDDHKIFRSEDKIEVILDERNNIVTLADFYKFMWMKASDDLRALDD